MSWPSFRRPEDTGPAVCHLACGRSSYVTTSVPPSASYQPDGNRREPSADQEPAECRHLLERLRVRVERRGHGGAVIFGLVVTVTAVHALCVLSPQSGARPAAYKAALNLTSRFLLG